MKYKYIAYILVLALTSTLTQAQVKIGKNPTTITPGALLDIEGGTTTTRTVSLTNGNFGVMTDSPIRTLDVNGNAGIRNNNFLEFGHTVAGKEAAAGKIGYALTTAGALDIYGAGTPTSFKAVKLWDHVLMGYGGSYLEFGNGNPSKHPAAGKMGYEITTAGALDIYGAGTNTSFKAVKLWDHVLIGYGGSYLEFGNGNSAKEANAGRIGYEVFTSGALDIVGAGTPNSLKAIKLWDKVLINGTSGYSGLHFENLNSGSIAYNGAPLGVDQYGDVIVLSGGTQVLSAKNCGITTWGTYSYGTSNPYAIGCTNVSFTLTKTSTVSFQYGGWGDFNTGGPATMAFRIHLYDITNNIYRSNVVTSINAPINGQFRAAGTDVFTISLPAGTYTYQLRCNYEATATISYATTSAATYTQFAPTGQLYTAFLTVTIIQ